MTLRTSLLLMALIHCSHQKVLAEEEGVAFFEAKVRPLLIQHCFECHSSEKKQKGDLTLDSRAGFLKGGESGAAVVPGNPEKSLLIQAVKHEGDYAMPPEKQLAAEEIAVLEKWVSQGAPFPDSGSPLLGMEKKLAQAKTHWSFQPLMKDSLPSVKQTTWVRNEIDHYILASIEAAGLSPAPEADPATLIRRVTFDLLGLPPTPEEVTAFVNNNAPDAYERLVENLLQNKHYGERWGRHWLDLARYADSSGFHNDLDRPWAWKYRDYVVDSFNEDKPYSRFVAEQLAGDEVSEANEQTLIATGFCRNGPSNDDNMGKTAAAIKQYRADQLDDLISTTSSVFLGVTIGCARCHDHKTDPFTAKDYYQLLAIFYGTEKYGLVPGTEDANGVKLKTDAAIQIQALVETKAKVPVTHVMKRGNAMNLGEEVEPAVPAVFDFGQPHFPIPPVDAKSSLRRRTLAEWITSPQNALAWRVLVNRIWQHHFGQGLVRTTSNFGFQGATPSHPELLDYLATRLITQEGRWKPLHKEILLSATYRQASSASAASLERDPENRLLTHMPLRRMEAEVLRDSILAVSGKLNLKFGGPGIKPRLPAELIPTSQRNRWPEVAKEDAQHWRRSLYIYSKRQLLMPIMELFDAPSTNESCATRGESLVPTQSLVLMNDDFVETQAMHFASRVLSQAEPDLPGTIAQMFELAYGRAPHSERLQQAEVFVRSREAQSSRLHALTDLAHVLFNSSEFIYIP